MENVNKTEYLLNRQEFRNPVVTTSLYIAVYMVRIMVWVYVVRVETAGDM
jgi:hypothetical protein